MSTAARQRLHAENDLGCSAGQGHDVLLFRFHALEWNPPDGLRAIQVLKLVPDRADDLGGPDGGECQKPDGHLGRREGEGALGPTQHGAERRQIDDGRARDAVMSAHQIRQRIGAGS